ncbi:lectin-like domain-containing protein [Luteolibacter luteus]|uniref:F5/8 type C domain-containing protein n=1 Tax=Luteolibacter luteus TaxID=2728835 RepID=A0A858RCC1_9BACT|nr:hypothetical protein [Luteolibacter luteus]QJE94676.1 hypothetical protein HHL09_02400 [Luteolibacter luteus]
MTPKKYPDINPGHSGNLPTPSRFTWKPLALATIAILMGGSASAAQKTYQYFRFQPTKIQNNNTQMQLAEFTFSVNGTLLNLNNRNGSNASVVPVTVTAGGQDPNAGEGPGKVADGLPLIGGNPLPVGQTSTKWFNGAALAVPLDFAFTEPVTVDSYNFCTANDSVAYNRSPVSWNLWGRTEEGDWELLDARNNVAIVNQNHTYQAGFTIPESVAPVINYFNIINTEFEGTAAIVKNGEQVTLEWDSLYGDLDGTTLAPAPGDVDQFGFLAVTPPSNATTVYTLTAEQAATSQAATANVTVRSVAGGASNFRYVRFKATKLRSGVGTGTIQLAEFELYSGESKLTEISVTNPGGDTPDAEGVEKLIDGIVAEGGNKWLDFTNSPVVFDLGTVSPTFDRYAFVTGGDAPERDPIQWTLEGSDDGVVWNLIEKVDFDYPTPERRLATTRTIPLPGISVVQPPEIAFFRARRDTSLPDDPIIFSWEVSGADSIKITPGTGEELPASGTLEFVATSDAVYTITATNAGGPATKSLSFGAVATPPASISYEDFSSAGDEFVLLGDASLVNDSPQIPNPGDVVRLRMVPDEAGKHGVSWYNQRIDLSGGFDTTFGLQLTCAHRGYGAEGLGFMIQNTPEGAAALPQDNGPASNALTVKFSSWENAEGILNEARINVFAGATKIGTSDLRQVSGITLRGQTYSTLTGPVDGTPYVVRVVYVPGDLDVYVDGVLALDSLDVDLGDIGAIDSEGTSYVGFVARTGGWDQASDITDWTMSATAGPGPAAPLTLASSAINPLTGNASFTWLSTAGKEYRITASTDLITFPTILMQDIPSEGVMTSRSVTFTPGTKLFFRIEEE